MHIHRLPNELKPLLALLDDPLGLPICRGCQAALLPRSLMDHLRKHHQLPVNLRATVKSLVATLPFLEFKDISNKPDGSAPTKALRVVDAYQCKRCPFIRRDLTDVRKHINKEHQVSATGSYDKIEAQTWFGGRRASYWKVCVPPQREFPEEPQCVWGFYGKGFGERTPKAWPREDENEDINSVL